MSAIRILVVDDEQNARDALRHILSDEGYLVSEAADGQEGLDKLTEFLPDVVLADVRMPRLDGLGLLKKAHERPRLCSRRMCCRSFRRTVFAVTVQKFKSPTWT